MGFRLWIDSDSVPVKHRQVVLRRAVRQNLSAVFVADRNLKDVMDAISEHSRLLREPYRDTLLKDELRKIRSSISMVIVETSANSADDYIVKESSSGDLCITHDIPLAARLVEKGVLVIDDRGHRYDEENIRERLSVRDTMYAIREMGAVPEKQKRFDAKLLEAFSNAFDSALNSILS